MQVTTKDKKIILAELDPQKRYLLVVNLIRVERQDIENMMKFLSKEEQDRIGIVLCFGDPSESISFVEIPKIEKENHG